MVLVLANATHFCTLGLALISSTGYIVAREPVHRVVAGPADHGKDLGALEPGHGGRHALRIEASDDQAFDFFPCASCS